MNGGMELYLHMPFCVRKCAYCDFLSFPTDQETQNLYTRRLREDIDAMGKKYGDPSGRYDSLSAAEPRPCRIRR